MSQFDVISVSVAVAGAENLLLSRVIFFFSHIKTISINKIQLMPQQLKRQSNEFN